MGVADRAMADDLSPEFVMYWSNYWEDHTTAHEIICSSTSPPSPQTTSTITPGLAAQASGISQTSTAATAATNTIPPGPTDSSVPNSSHQLTRGEVVGIGVVAALGGILFLGLLGMFLYRYFFEKMWRRRKERNHNLNNVSNGHGMDGPSIAELAGEDLTMTAELESECKKPILPPSELASDIPKWDLQKNELDSISVRPTELDSNQAIGDSLKAAELDANNSGNVRVPPGVAKGEAGTRLISPASPGSNRAVSRQQPFPYTPPMDLEHGYGYDGTPGATAYQWFPSNRQGQGGA